MTYKIIVTKKDGTTKEHVTSDLMKASIAMMFLDEIGENYVFEEIPEVRT